MTGEEAVEWVEDVIGWDGIDDSVVDYIEDGYSRDDAIHLAINEALAEHGGENRVETGIWATKYKNNISNQIAPRLFVYQSILGRVDDIQRDISSGASARQSGNSVVVTYENGEEMTYYQTATLARNKGLI